MEAKSTKRSAGMADENQPSIRVIGVTDCVPTDDVRDEVVDQLERLVRRIDTEILVSYLPVLASHADVSERSPRLRVHGVG